jgi:hypothetical protein
MAPPAPPATTPYTIASQFGLSSSFRLFFRVYSRFLGYEPSIARLKSIYTVNVCIYNWPSKCRSSGCIFQVVVLSLSIRSCLVIFATYTLVQTVRNHEQDLKLIYVHDAISVRPCLHETGTKSNRDHFVSVIVLFIIDVYMRPRDENNSDRSQLSHSAYWTEPTDFRPRHEFRLGSECKHKLYISDRSQL